MQDATNGAPVRIEGIRPRSPIALALLRMAVGDEPLEFPARRAATAKSTASNYGRRLGREYVTRTRGKKLRVWRVA